MTLDKEANKLRKEIFAHMKYAEQLDPEFMAERMDKLVGYIEDYFHHYNEVWLERPDQSHDCPTWYDGCHCTVDTLRYNIERAEKAEDRLSEVMKLLGWCRDDFVTMIAMRDDPQWIEQRATSRVTEIERFDKHEK